MPARRPLLLLALLVAGLCALALPGGAAAAEESASTAKWPWSGYWRPYLKSSEGSYNLYADGGAL